MLSYQQNVPQQVMYYENPINIKCEKPKSSRKLFGAHAVVGKAVQVDASREEQPAHLSKVLLVLVFNGVSVIVGERGLVSSYLLEPFAIYEGSCVF
jgi:hypothetical protein